MANTKSGARYANGNRKAQQKAYNKTAKGKELRASANKANRELGTYGNRDGKDASHTGPNRAKTENASTNRARPRKGKRYAPGSGSKVGG